MPCSTLSHSESQWCPALWHPSSHHQTQSQHLKNNNTTIAAATSKCFGPRNCSLSKHCTQRSHVLLLNKNIEKSVGKSTIRNERVIKPFILTIDDTHGMVDPGSVEWGQNTPGQCSNKEEYYCIVKLFNYNVCKVFFF